MRGFHHQNFGWIMTRYIETLVNNRMSVAWPIVSVVLVCRVSEDLIVQSRFGSSPGEAFTGYFSSLDYV